MAFPLSSLPFELVMEIASLLPLPTAFAFARSSRLGRDVLREPLVCRALLSSCVSSAWTDNPVLLRNLAFFATERAFSSHPIPGLPTPNPPNNDNNEEEEEEDMMEDMMVMTAEYTRLLPLRPYAALRAFAAYYAYQLKTKVRSRPQKAALAALDIPIRKAYLDLPRTLLAETEALLSSRVFGFGLHLDLDVWVGASVSTLLGYLRAQVTQNEAGTDAGADADDDDDDDDDDGFAQVADTTTITDVVPASLRAILVAVIAADAVSTLHVLESLGPEVFGTLGESSSGWTIQSLRVLPRLSTFPLHIAAFFSAHNIVSDLLARPTAPAALSLRESMFSQTPLLVAIQRDKSPYLCIRAILAHPALDPTAVDRHGMGPSSLLAYRTSSETESLRHLLQSQSFSTT